MQLEMDKRAIVMSKRTLEVGSVAQRAKAPRLAPSRRPRRAWGVGRSVNTDDERDERMGTSWHNALYEGICICARVDDDIGGPRWKERPVRVRVRLLG